MIDKRAVVTSLVVGALLAAGLVVAGRQEVPPPGHPASTAAIALLATTVLATAFAGDRIETPRRLLGLATLACAGFWLAGTLMAPAIDVLGG